jgi:protein CpxP
MSRNKLLLFIVAILFLANVVLLYFFFKGKEEVKPPSREHRGISEQLKNDVGFNQEQLKAYDLRREKHMSEMKGLFEGMRQTKEQFFNTIKDPNPNDSLVQASARNIAEQQKAIDLRTHAYFTDLRKICSTDQLPKFDSLYQEVIKRMISMGRRPSGNRENLKK